MSKERELLKKIWVSLDSDRDTHLILVREIEELLAQPEKTEQEQEPKIGFRGLRTNGDSYSQEPVAWKDNNYGNLHHQNWGDPRPLYAAPQKQEPSTSAREMYQRGYAQAELDSKRKQEPLSDDVINDIFVNNQWVTFLTLARLLEKAQGIGE